MLWTYVFWLFTFVVTGTKVLFSNTIEKSLIEKTADGTPIYRIRLMNIGHRDLVDVVYTARLCIRIKDGEMIRTTYLCLGYEQTVPILSGKDKKKVNLYSTHLLGFYVKDAARNEFSKSIYSEIIQSKAKTGILVLDDLLHEYGNKLNITVFATGNDRLTGARKTFVSKKYTIKDIIEGRFTKWNGLPRGIRKYFNKVQMAIKIISQIDTIEGVLQRTYVDLNDTLINANPNAKDFLGDNLNLRKPKNEYQKIETNEINEKIKLLKHILYGMNSDQTSSKSLRAGVMLLERNLLTLNFIKASYDYLHSDGTNKEQIAALHMDLNSKLYGLPKKEVFNAILQEINEKKVSNDKIRYDSIFHPKKEIIERFSCAIIQHMDSLLSHIPKNQEFFTVQEVCCIANEILTEELKASEFGWKAIVESDASTESVNQKERIIRFPGKRSKGNYTYHDIRAILAHEIGVHVKRALPANRIGSFALSIGLPGYEVFEEGLAVAVEQAVNQEYCNSGYIHYLSISFVLFEHMDFHQAFTKGLEIWGDTEENRKAVFDSVQQAFRGTGELINSKNLVYYNGAEIFWRYVENHIEEKDMINNLFKFGKIDNSRKDHIEFAKRILQEAKY